MTQTAPPQRATAKPSESLWRNRNFLLLWAGQGAGTLGPRVAMVALPLLALDVLNASTFQASLLTFLGWLPYLLFSLPAGVLADRWDQRRLMIGCDVGRMLLMLSVPLVAMAGLLSLPYLYAVVSLSGVLTVLFTIAYRSQLPKLVASTQLIDGNGKLGTCERFAELLGPALGGFLVGVVGAARALFVNVLTYALSAVALAMMRIPRSVAEAAGAERPTFRSAMREGLAFVRQETILRRLLICTSVLNFFVMAATSIEVTFMLRDLHASAATIGLVFTGSAFCGLVAGLFAHRIANRVGTARIIWLAMLVPGPLYFLMPLSTPGWGVILFALGLAGLAMNSTLFNTGSMSYRQLVCPPRLLSRVSAVYLWICYGVIPFGALFGGFLGSTAGLRPALWVCAAGMWSASIFVFFSPLRRMRDIPIPEVAVR